MNEKKVPQLFVQTGATKWNDPKQFPWTMGWQPNYQSEGHIYAKYILKERPTGKIAILYQNDDYGKDYVKGIRDGLARRKSGFDRHRAPTHHRRARQTLATMSLLSRLSRAT